MHRAEPYVRARLPVEQLSLRVYRPVRLTMFGANTFTRWRNSRWSWHRWWRWWWLPVYRILLGLLRILEWSLGRDSALVRRLLVRLTIRAQHHVQPVN
jgi:hypothetical protein